MESNEPKIVTLLDEDGNEVEFEHLLTFRAVCSILYSVVSTSAAARCGSIAQLGEHLPYKQGVTGSSPVAPTIGPVVQLVRMPACHAGGQGFEPPPGRQLPR